MTQSLAKRSEKGLLTPNNCVVAIIDPQPEMLFGVGVEYAYTMVHGAQPKKFPEHVVAGWRGAQVVMG